MENVEAGQWVAVISGKDIHLAAPLRQTQGVEVLPLEECVWLRGPLPTEFDASQLDERLLRLVPGVRPYLLLEDGQLTRLGDRVPSNRLPKGAWQPLAKWLRVELPQARTTITPPLRPVSLSLVRTADERQPTLLLTSLSSWVDYAALAPQWRLERLMFVADSSGQVLIRGLPLPPIPGEQWVDRDGIATRAGWVWHPPIASLVLAKKFCLQAGDVALLDHSQWQLVQRDDWVRGSRAAARSTGETLHEP